MKRQTSEEQLIDLIRSYVVSDPRQVNAPFTSDAELMELSNGQCLACTTDSLQEELHLGILEDPWTIGWTVVNMNLSDLAAVGAEPLGLLLAWTLPGSYSGEAVREISRGIADAANVHKTALLGGDVNNGPALEICGTAIGLVRKTEARQRIGMKPGDFIFVTGPIGLGNALGLAKLRKMAGASKLEMQYRPLARFDAGPVIREFASSCIDSSDGLFASLDILSRLNNCGVTYYDRPEFYHSGARCLASDSNIPLWLFAAAEHGEFELVFSVPEKRLEACRKECKRLWIELLEIGRATNTPGFWIAKESRNVEIDIAYVRGLSGLIRESPANYVQSMLTYARTVGL